MRTRASLVIEHATLTAAAVTQALDVAPTRSYERGDPVLPGSSVREHSYWVIDSGLADAGDDLESHLAALLARIAPRHDQVLELSAAGYRMSWLCFVSAADGQGRVRLSPEFLSQIADLPVGLGFDIYAITHQPD